MPDEDSGKHENGVWDFASVDANGNAKNYPIDSKSNERLYDIQEDTRYVHRRLVLDFSFGEGYGEMP